MNTKFDVIVIGAGPAGIMASIEVAKNSKKVLLLEKMPKIALKLKATGGGKCNLTNRLSKEEFIKNFGKDGRFISDALNNFDSNDLENFFEVIGVKTHSPDGFRVFPTTHNSSTILDALENELNSLNIDIRCNTNIENIEKKDDKFFVLTKENSFESKSLILATGGLGYPALGSTGDGYIFSKSFGHKITSLYPAMMPLKTKETWVEFCKADTIANAIIKIDIPKYKKLKATGDLIFTKDGVRGPVILDFAREITPLLEKFDEVPLLVNLTKGLNEEQILQHFKKQPTKTMLELLNTLLPISVSQQLLKECKIDETCSLKTIDGVKKQMLIKYLAWTPFCIIGHDGFKNAMITRGGVSLKEIDPKTMQSKLVKDLYFCGEIVDLDGPCGGYNLQWSFSSGYLAGSSASND